MRSYSRKETTKRNGEGQETLFNLVKLNENFKEVGRNWGRWKNSFQVPKTTEASDIQSLKLVWHTYIQLPAWNYQYMILYYDQKRVIYLVPQPNLIFLWKTYQECCTPKCCNSWIFFCIIKKIKKGKKVPGSIQSNNLPLFLQNLP